MDGGVTGHLHACCGEMAVQPVMPRATAAADASKLTRLNDIEENYVAVNA